MAEPLYKHVVTALIVQLGADHPHTLTVKNNLGVLYLQQAKFDQAEPLLQEVIDARTAKLGADHPDTLASKHNLAGMYLEDRKYERAEPLFKEVIAAESRKLGPDHPDTLMSKHQLGRLYRANRKYDQAEPLFKEVIAAQVGKLGADHPDTLMSKFSLAGLYQDHGKYDRAAPLLQEVIAGRTAKLGAEHPATLKSKQDLAMLYAARRQTTHKAEPLLRELAEFWNQKAGPDGPQYAAALAMLGLNLLAQEKGTDAEAVVRQCLTIRQQNEPDGWSTFNTKSMLGGALLLQKKYAQAEPLLVQGYEGMKQREAKIPAPGRVRLAEALERLLQLYDSIGAKQKAAELRQKVHGSKLAAVLWEDLLTGQEARHRFIESKQQGSLTAEKAKHVHAFEMKAGSTYVFDMESKAFDTLLILHNSDGVHLAENDDISSISPANLNSRIIYTAPNTATYRVIATAYRPGAAGPYLLRIRELVGNKAPKR